MLPPRRIWPARNLALREAAKLAGEEFLRRSAGLAERNSTFKGREGQVCDQKRHDGHELQRRIGV